MIAFIHFERYIRLMDIEINTEALLEWYLDAGVDETCGDEPSLRQKEAEKAVLKPTASTASESYRQVMTPLAQAPTAASANARELCEKAETLDDLRKIVEEFDGCALKFNAKSTVFGDGRPHAPLLIVGEAPGADEDRIGKPFVGQSGKLLEKMLLAIGLKRQDVYITNIVPWRPPGNRTPTDAETAVCLPFLKRQIELVEPKYLLLLGGSAVKALLDNPEPISKLRGHWLTYQPTTKLSIEALATFHPAYLLRNAATKAKAWSDFLRIHKKLKEN